MNLKPIFTIRLVSVLCFFFIATAVFSQEESVIYVGTNGKLTTIDHAVFMQKTLAKSPQSFTVQTLKLNNSIWEKIYSEKYIKLNDSTYQIKGIGKNIQKNKIRTFVPQTDKSWKFRDVVKGQMIRSGSASSVVPLLLQGEVTEFYPGGNKKSISEYNNNELVSNENWDQNGDKYIDNIFYSVDTVPSFNAGINVMHQHILKGFKDAGIDISAIKGSLIVGFVVKENGTIDGIKIIKGLGPNINNVAYNSFMTLALKGNWTPAKLNDQTVRYFQVFPINFIDQPSLVRYIEVRHDDLRYGIQ